MVDVLVRLFHYCVAVKADPMIPYEFMRAAVGGPHAPGISGLDLRGRFGVFCLLSFG